MNAHGNDTSKWQYPIDYELGRECGLSFNVTRATVGDYYTDITLPEIFNGYRQAGLLESAYLVTAPSDPTLSRQISVQAHLDRFFDAVACLQPDLPWVVDAELDRGQSKTVITNLIKGVVIGLYNASGRYPIIYTRQTWWDTYVNPDPLWKLCPLWAARYASWLTSPWSDGNCRFRDWSEWKFWQYTNKGDGKYYGVGSLQLDLDWFNGDIVELYEFAGLPKPITIEDKVNILWREAELHGWNLEP